MLGQRFLSSIAAATTLLLGANAFATLTYSSSAGTSAIDISDTAKPIVYGSFAGTCTPDSTSTTCNSCTSTTDIFPCSTSAIPSTNTNFVITLTVNNSSVTAPTTGTVTPTVKMGGSTGQVVGTTDWVSGSGQTALTVTVPWSDLCSKATSAGGNTDCSTNVNADLYIAFENVGGSTDSILVRIITSYANGAAASSYIDCADTDTNTSKVGFCHFKAFPGDEKIYADELSVGTSYPSSPSGANYKNAVFFYEEQQTGETDADTVARISNSSPMTLYPYNTSGSESDDPKVTGLVNGVRYCMLMASQDLTGTIQFFTDRTAVGFDPTTVCGMPEPVVGLLDDKHCFIATAAFGSDMAPEVQSFRDFRNEYLLPFAWGKKFVQTYYKYSPKYANMIAGNETAKATVRIALWPLLLFARMSVAFGFWITLLIMGAAMLTFYGLYRRLILGRNVRGEL
ncbi:CFI-box-CTERM domain-containing protein [Bdellovibrio sp. NC01]|uniref:CFI-box-CTERM domain-containing protein n=1 Tax=Bdellovibrio sp. NC01 TaxID=2220073 RepID=UPI00115A9C3F|nr:CFI-box-CTERM domain-containing protein [Bdellovibrio sp. NC01]